MTYERFSNFGELYRAAFSENDAQRKVGLLHEVQRIIESGRTSDPPLEIESADSGPSCC